MLDWMKTFGVSGGAGEIEEAKRRVKGIRGEPVSPEKRELQEIVAPGEKKFFGLKEKPGLTYQEALETLGSDSLVEQALGHMEAVRQYMEQDPKNRQAYEDYFFTKYPSLKGRVQLWQPKKKEKKPQ